MDKDIRELRQKAEKEFSSVNTPQKLESLRIEYLGSKGKLRKLTSKLSNLNPQKRSKAGKQINEFKKEIEQKIEDAQKTQEASIKEEKIDITLPGAKPQKGNIHPVHQAIEEIAEIFHYLGFSIVEGPEIETDEYNFQKLRIPPNHPSRDQQDSFYIKKNVLLRTHTSPMQVRFMEKNKPPIRALFPGLVHRRDPIDAVHMPSFWQVEGLFVDRQTSASELLGVLDFFVKKMFGLNFFTQKIFGANAKARVYGHYFPYTEPSIEIEIKDKLGRWIEILGCGVVHPEVLKNGGIDPDKYRGWAFGMGPDRIAMLKWGIEDIRLLFGGDLRFLKQF